MMIFEAIDAGHGDAIMLRYRSENMGCERVIVLIEAGPKSAKNEKGEVLYSRTRRASFRV